MLKGLLVSTSVMTMFSGGFLNAIAPESIKDNAQEIKTLDEANSKLDSKLEKVELSYNTSFKKSETLKKEKEDLSRKLKSADSLKSSLETQIKTEKARIQKEENEAIAKKAEEKRKQYEEEQRKAEEKREAERVKAEEEASKKSTKSIGDGAGEAPKGRELIMESTAYSIDPRDGMTPGFITATGQDLRVNPKAVAVDPSVIPLGSRVWVEGYGEAIASDTGSSINGSIIDVHFSDYDSCVQWGRRTVKVIVLD